MSNECQDKERRESCPGNRLFSEFPHQTYEEWRQVAEKSLKGASFEKKLFSKTYEEIDLQPIYWQKDVDNLSHKNRTCSLTRTLFIFVARGGPETRRERLLECTV
jgi:hypothetical protein